jgi:NADPH:quinone reductase-like Zn-dependent oxidoreductase
LLINGVGGGVGVMAAQLARNRGAAVFGVGSQTKWSMTESLGATLVPYDSGDVVKQMRQLLPGGVDAILDVIGGEPMRHVAILITNPARIVSIADPSVTEWEAASCSPAGQAFPPSPTWSPPAKSIPKCSRPTPSTKHHRHCEQWNPVTLSARS